MTREARRRLHYFKNAFRPKKMQPELWRAGHTKRKQSERKQDNFKELIMSFLADDNAIGVVAMAIPVVGSIALFSFLAVATWSRTRGAGREKRTTRAKQ